MNIPNQLPILAEGAHQAGAREVCAMEAASWLANEEHSDRPECVHPAIAEFARRCNDASTDEERQTLWPLILRSMGTATDDHVLNVRLAIWCATQVLFEFESRHPNDDRPRKALESAEAWADCPCDEHRDYATANATNATAALFFLSDFARTRAAVRALYPAAIVSAVAPKHIGVDAPDGAATDAVVAAAHLRSALGDWWLLAQVDAQLGELASGFGRAALLASKAGVFHTAEGCSPCCGAAREAYCHPGHGEHFLAHVRMNAGVLRRQ